MMKFNKINLAFLGIIFSGITVFAQDSSYLSMDEAVSTAVENNSNIKLSEWDRKVANAGFRQTDAIFLPQISVGYTALTTNNPLNAFGFLLQQESVTAMDFDPAKLNNPGATQNYGAQVEAKLPLINMDMIFARKGAKVQEEMYQYKSQRTKEYIEYEVKKAYTQLQLSYRAKAVLQKSLDDVRQIYQSVNNFYNQGLIQKSDVLSAQIQVNTIESALAKAESNILNASDGLRLLMGMDAGNEPYITDTLLQKITQPQAYTELSLRADMLAMNKAVDAAGQMVKSSKMAFLPRINAFGTYQLNDSEAFKFRNESYLAGINLSWSIFSGNQNHSKMKSAQFQFNKMREERDLQLRQSRLELDKTLRELHDLQIEIDKQKVSLEQADEALRILTNRYREGLVSTTDLLTAQARSSQQELLLAQAVMSYNITQAYVEFLSKTE
ncbi:MAG: TolC family protein [Tannerella sp.]|nr:TolC family protein [Tannerella sp.]